MQWLIDIIAASVLASFQGMILLWSGAIVDIPDGWALCDGTQGTPDLTDKFIMGAGTLKNPGDTGGTTSHNHSFNDGGHQHEMESGTDLAAGTDFDEETSTEVASGFTSTKDHKPPYYALAYIMRL